MKPTLSILTPTIPGREKQAEKLSWKIAAQIGDLPVEHLVLSDNRKRSIGAKRQSLIDIADGLYVAFCDDDDDISDDYVLELFNAAQHGADVITFKQHAIYNGAESTVIFGINHKDGQFNPGGDTIRAPWHVCAWRKAAVETCQFGMSNYGEDAVWCKQARRRIATGFHIDKVLHTYRHDATTTAAPEPV